MSSRFFDVWELVPPLRRLWREIDVSRGLFVTVVISSMASSVMEGIGIGLLIPLVALLQGDVAGVLSNRFLVWIPNLFPNRTDIFYVSFFCVLVLSAVTLKNLLLLFASILQERVYQKAGSSIRGALFRRMLSAPQQVFDEKKAGELTHVYNVESLRAQQSIDYSSLLVQRSFLGALYFFFVLSLSWQLTIGLALLAAAIGSVTVSFHSYLRRRGDERSVAYKDLYSFIGQTFGGIRIVRATHSERDAIKTFSKLNEDAAEIERKGLLMARSMGPLTEIFAVAGGMVLLSGSYALLIQRGLLSPAALMVFGVILIRMLPLLNQVYGLVGQLNFSGAGVHEVLRWLDSPQFPSRPFGSRPFKGIRQGIRVDDVSFTYPNGTVALSNASFEIPAGHTVALVGASGSGKSTLASLLLRVREPSGGHIFVDDTDYWEYSPVTWHARLGMVEQEAFLFNESVEANILLGVAPGAGLPIDEAIRIAHLEEVIEQLPRGLATVVGERGTLLSGGQKQRMAIARAVVRDPDLLILDEATSALDNYSERLVQAALNDARRGRTSLVIAHRLSTIRSADMIIVMDKGRVVEMGDWATLEARDGVFKRLVNAAAGGVLSGGALDSGQS